MINLIATALLQVGNHRAVVPFGVGERFEYEGSTTFIVKVSAGGGVLTVAGVDTLHGIPVWRFNFKFNVSVPLYHNNSEFTSWTGVSDFISRRIKKSVHEGGFNRDEDYAIHGDSGFYRNQLDGQTTPTPRDALDDVALFYYIRTIPFTVGQPTVLHNFFRKDRNPVTINVLRREACELPGKVKAMCLVLNPIVEDEPNGLFMKKHDARLWITDDFRRIPVKIQATVFKRLTLTLSRMTPGN